MATVGNLFINVKARTASFSKKMKGVRASVARLAKGFGKIAAKVGKFAAVLGGIAVAAITAFTLAGIKSVDMLGKVSKKLGLTSSELQVLRLAATSTGITVETLDMALQRMARRVGEAAVGTGEAQGALKELGLSAKELNNLSTDKVFMRVAEAMEKVTNTQDRLRLSMKLFDSEGAALHLTMMGGKAALEEYGKEARELGILLSSNQVNAVETLATKLGFLGSVWTSLGQNLAVEFAPILTEITNRIIQFIKASGGMGQIAEYIVKSFMYAGAAVLDVIRAIQIGWLGLKTAVIQVASDMVLAMGWAVQKMAEGWHWLEGQALSVMGRIAEGGAELLQGAGIESSYLNILLGIGRGAQKVGASGLEQAVKSQTADLLKLMGESLGSEATQLGTDLLDKIAEGMNWDNVDGLFDGLKEKFMGEGLGGLGDGFAEIELISPDFKGAAESLSTAVGNMKIDAGSQERLLERQLVIEQKQLKTSQDTLRAIKDGSGVLT